VSRQFSFLVPTMKIRLKLPVEHPEFAEEPEIDEVLQDSNEGSKETTPGMSSYLPVY